MTHEGAPTDHAADPTAAAPPVAIAAVSVKLPPFWPADTEVWFAQVEAQFTTRSITSQKTQFDYVVSSLSPEFASEVRDLLLRPPEAAPYDKLKTELIKQTAASEQRKLQQLISGEELGDRKPTQLLRRMQQLLGNHAAETNNTFLQELFLQRLPPNVRMVLASTGDTMDLNQLADMADKVMEVVTPTVLAIAQETPSEVKQLWEEVHVWLTLWLPSHGTTLVGAVASLGTTARSQRHSIPRSNSLLVPPEIWGSR